MKRFARILTVAVPLAAVLATPLSADVKTRERASAKFESRLLNFFLGKAAKEGVVSSAAVKGNRKATMNETTGQIIDLSEEKVYDLDIKKKQYTVTTFDELRRRMREAEEKAKKEADKAEKAEPGEKRQAEKPNKEYEIDFNVKDTGQKKAIAGYDTHETVVTITVREKGKTLEESGGMVMTNDMWLGPQVPQMKELSDFDVKYWKQLEGPGATMLSAEQMATVLAMFPLIAKANERMQKDADKLAGTPLDTTTTFEAVKSKDELTQAQQQEQKPSGGLGGMLAKKIMKQEPPKQRSTIMTLHHEVLEIGTSAGAADVAIPPDFKEKK